MKTVVAFLLVVASSGAVMAQKGPLEPAPVPAVDDGRVAPADRAGRSDSADSGAPFSGAPTGMEAGTGQGTPQTQGAATGEQPPTPSLSR